MKNRIIFLTILLLANKTLADRFVVTPSIAYRYDVFKWSVPDNIFTDKKLSELVWKNRIIQPSIKFEVEPTANQFTFVGVAKYGYILKSTSKSWDYDWEYHPTIPNSKTFSSVTGNILDLSGGIGYSVKLSKDNLITLYVGYDYTDYKNNNYGFRQLALNQNKLIYPFNQIGQKYYFKTTSPWIGLSVNAQLNDRWSIIPTIKYYSFKYMGKGYWILRDELKKNPSFKHNVKGNGIGFDVNFLYKYSDTLDFKINLKTKKFKMKTGKNKIFCSDKYIDGERVVNRKLYDMSLISSSISWGFRYKI